MEDTIAKDGDANRTVLLAIKTAPTCNSIKCSFGSWPREIPILGARRSVKLLNNAHEQKVSVVKMQV